MPNGQRILVKCEVKARGGDVFDMIVAHSNLMEHFYFGLAYIDGKYIKKNNPKTIVWNAFSVSLICPQIMSFFSWTMTQRFPRLLQIVGRKCLRPHLSFISGSNFSSMTFLFFCKCQQSCLHRENNLPLNLGRMEICIAFSDRHKQTQHQYYLQLRRDLLEDRLCCHEDTALYLGALALQTEFGDCMPEVLHQTFKTEI